MAHVFSISLFNSLRLLFFDDLFHILFIELSYCIENGFMICTTGKISHIVSIMDGIDSNFNSIKPIYIIKDEIKNLANNIRKNIMKGV